MPIPTSYTELGLKGFMLKELGDIRQVLRWTVSATDLDQAVLRTLRAYGVNAVESATNMGRLEALATLEVWRAAVRALVVPSRLNLDDTAFNPQATGERARRMLAEAETAAARFVAPIPFAGGLSRSEKRADRQDRDRVQPYFTREMDG